MASAAGFAAQAVARSRRGSTTESRRGTDEEPSHPAHTVADMPDYAKEREDELQQKTFFGGRRRSRELARAKFEAPPPRRSEAGASRQSVCVEDVRLTVASMQDEAKGVINPATSKFMGYWDIVMLLCLVFTALVTPYEVVFLSGGKLDLLFYTNRVVDGLFVVDMLLNFNMAYQAPPERGSIWVFDKRDIRWHYFTSWFWIDLISILPLWIMSFYVGEAEAAFVAGAGPAPSPPSMPGVAHVAAVEQKSAAEMLQIIRIFRLLRLLKITRVIKASRIFKRFETSMEITYASLGMIKLLIVMFAWSHLQACLWGLLPQLEAGFEDKSWLDGLRAEHADCSLFPSTCTQEMAPWDQYAAALYFSVMTLTSVGYGQMLPVNTTERLVNSVFMLFSAILWCYTMGQACGIAATMDPHGVEFRTTMDGLNFFMRERGLPRRLKFALRSYFHNSRSLHRAVGENHLFHMMSPLLATTVALTANKAWLDRVWYLRTPPKRDPAYSSHSGFVSMLALKLAAQSFIAQERLPSGQLYVVRRGLVIKRWRIMTKGKVWGEDMILDAHDLIDTSEAVALTYIEVYVLTRPELDACCRQFPECGRRIRKSARKMMIQRLVIRTMRAKCNLPVRSFVHEKQTELRPVTLDEKVSLIIDALPEARLEWTRLIGQSAEEMESSHAASLERRRKTVMASAPAAALVAALPAAATLPSFLSFKPPSAAPAGLDATMERMNKLVAMQKEMAAAQQQVSEEMSRLAASVAAMQRSSPGKKGAGSLARVAEEGTANAANRGGSAGVGVSARLQQGFSSMFSA